MQLLSVAPVGGRAEAIVHTKVAGTDETNSGNIRSALGRGLPEFQPALVHNDGTFVVVGSGHSVTDFLAEIKQEREKGRPICAVKGTHDWLIENDCPPNLFVSCEPRVRPLKHTFDGTIYLLASRCPLELFDQLAGNNVMLWHSWSSEGEAQELIEKRKFFIGGGPTSGMRAICLGYMMGFRNFVLYGFDSCLAADGNTKRFTGEEVGTALKVDIWVGRKRFWCNGALADQAHSFEGIYEAFHDIHIEARGNGLIAAILERRKAKGNRV